MYNLGTGKGTSVLEMVAAFEKASGKVVFNCIPPPCIVIMLHPIPLNGRGKRKPQFPSSRELFVVTSVFILVLALLFFWGTDALVYF